MTPLFLRTQEEFQNHKIVLHQGGSRSSKTWSIFQFLLSKAIVNRKGNKVVLTIVRDKLTWIKSTLLKDFEEILLRMELPVTPEINPNRPEQIYNVNGVEFGFFGLDYPQKLHGRKQDFFWINEAMEVAQKHFEQLEMRTTQGGILDYNPYDDLHWVFDLHKREDVAVIKSTMLNNPFLEDTIIKKIKSYEPTLENIKAGTADEYMWQVYGLGEKAKLQGVIFSNWEMKEIPKHAKLLGYGLDFGYTNDPTALIAVYQHDNEIYLDEIIYETGLLNTDIVERMKSLKIDPYADIYADSSEPKSIEEIKRGGFFNIKGAEKGQDSVKFGIDLMKSQKVNYTKRSVNVDKEYRRYKWKEDRLGRVLNEPIDAFNHALDASRYCIYMTLRAKPMVRIRSRADLGI